MAGYPDPLYHGQPRFAFSYLSSPGRGRTSADNDSDGAVDDETEESETAPLTTGQKVKQQITNGVLPAASSSCLHCSYWSLSCWRRRVYSVWCTVRPQSSPHSQLESTRGQ